MKKTSLKFFKIIVFASLVSAALVPSVHAFAADFSIVPEAGASCTLDVLLDPQGQAINAVEGNVDLPAGYVAGNIGDGSSIISAWIQSPVTDAIATSSAGQTISFSGIIAGGFAGTRSPFYAGTRPGKIFAFSVVGTGGGVIHFEKVQALEDDGQGTPASSTAGTFSPGNCMFSSSTPAVSSPARPDIFVPALGRSAAVFGGKWFVAFSANDPLSGIDYYEVQESLTATTTAGAWVRTSSPYELTDQSLHSYIYVRAVNNAGGKRTEMLAPAGQGISGVIDLSFLEALLVILIIAGITYRIAVYYGRIRKIKK